MNTYENTLVYLCSADRSKHGDNILYGITSQRTCGDGDVDSVGCCRLKQTLTEVWIVHRTSEVDFVLELLYPIVHCSVMEASLQSLWHIVKRF